MPVRRVLYHPATYDPRPVASYWQASAGPAPLFSALEGDQRCQVAIVGGGYTGLSAALHLARDHGIEVCLLEAAQPGWGASGRNGGFCCLGGAKLSYPALLRRFGLEAAREFFAVQRTAIERVPELAAQEGIALDAQGDGEYCLAHKPNRWVELAAAADCLRATFGLQCELLAPAALAERGIRDSECHGGLYTPLGFGLHPLKYAYGLARAASRHGVRLFGASRVLGWQRAAGRHQLVTARGRIEAPTLILAGNGYSDEALHPALAGAPLPVLSNILVTRPLTASERAAQGWHSETMAYDSRQLLHYFRLLPDGRFLFGGRGGLSAAPAAAAGCCVALIRHFRRAFPAWREVGIDYFWQGLACLARDRLPHVGPLPDDPTVLIGMAYHGNGVALAGWSGQALARLAAGSAAATVPALMRRPLPRFPWPRLRLLYLRAAYSGYQWLDEWR